MARSRWALLRALLPTLLRTGTIRLPTERDGIDAAAFTQPQCRLSRVAFAAVFNHDVDGCALALFRIADVPDAEVSYAVRVDRQVFLEFAPQGFRR